MTDTENEKEVIPHQPELNTQQTVTKSPQELIHIKHNITGRQYKYWFLMIRAYKELLALGVAGSGKDNGRYYVPVSYFDKMMGYKLKREDVKADLENLRQQPLILNYLGKDGKATAQGIGFISEWFFSDAYIGFTLPSIVTQAVKNEFENAKHMFLLLDWGIFNSFTSKYEGIIYKLCKDYAGVKRTPYFSIEKYREYVGLSAQEYVEFKELNRRTICGPVKVINNNPLSDISIEVKFKRVNRVIVGFYFEIEPKQSLNSQTSDGYDGIEVHTSHPAFDEALVNISVGTQNLYLMKYSEEEVVETIKRANQYIKELQDAGKDANMGAIYNKAFKEAWGTEIVTAREKQKALEKRKAEAKIKEQEEKKAQKQLDDETKRTQEEYEQEALEQVFNALSEENQLELIDMVRKQVSMVAFFKKDFEASVADGTILRNPQFSFHFKKLLGLAK